MKPNWSLWRRQVAAVLRLEWKRSLFAKRAWWIYLLALWPMVVTGAHWLAGTRFGPRRSDSLAQDGQIYAVFFRLFYLKLAIFFGCVGVFSNLFRSEVLEKTLHYYFLAPVRREVVLAGKYLAGLIASILFFTTSVVAAFLMISAHFGSEYWDFIWHGAGLGQLGWYALITVLACAGYGAVFLVIGLVYRNPMIPAAVIMVWENINGFLPPALKKVSVVFYLKSLCPVDVPIQGALALIAMDAEPAAPWLAISGLIVVSGLILVYAAKRVRRLEVSYSE